MISHPLFSTFPREVLALSRPNKHGKRIANRSIILSQKELISFIRRYSGCQDPFVSSFVFKGDVGVAIVDKLPFDFDIEHYPYPLKFAKWLHDNKIGFVPVGTHFDRFHIYVPIVPQKLTPLEYQEAQLSLLEQSKCYRKVCTKCGEYIGEMMMCCNGNTHYQPMADTHIIGDIRRVLRIPNTPRLPEVEGGEITSYCTYLPQNFYEMDQAQIYSLLKHPNEMETPDYFPQPLSEITIPLTRHFRSYVKEQVNIEELEDYTPTDPLLQFVKSIIRPCLWSSFCSINPPHFVRLATIIDLRDLGFSFMDLFEVCSRMGWKDWKTGVTEYQITDVLGGDLLYYHCHKLRGKTLPCFTDCKYRANGYQMTPMVRRS